MTLAANPAARATSSPSTLPVLVAGGGIGGLAAALALVRHGYEVLVLEQAAELGEIGAGIQLGPNAFAAFDALGVVDNPPAHPIARGETVRFIPFSELLA